MELENLNSQSQPHATSPTSMLAITHNNNDSMVGSQQNHLVEDRTEEEQKNINGHKKQPSRKQPWRRIIRLLIGLLLPTILETMDYTIVSTSQARIASYFNSLELQTWIGTGYILTSTCFLPIYGTIADVYGRYIGMQTSLLFYLLGNSICCGAKSMPMLIGGRAIAGIGAAGTLSIVRVIISDSSSLTDNNWQTGLMVVMYTVGYTVGPTVGGALSDVNWRWIFGLKIPICLVSMILCFICLRPIVKGPQPPRNHLKRRMIEKKREHDAKTPSNLEGNARIDEEYRETFIQGLKRIDWIGSAIFVAAGILIILGLNWGSTNGWKTAKVIVCLVLSGLLFVVFIAWECYLDQRGLKQRTVTESMIPIDMFASYDVSATSFICLASGMVMFCIFYFIGLYFTVVSSLSSKDAGVQLLYFAPGMGGGTYLSIFIIRQTRQPRYAIMLGCIIFTVGCGVLSSVIPDNDRAKIAGFLAMTGVGVGMTFGPVSIHTRFKQPEHLVAVVIAVQQFFRTFGGTIGLAQLGAVLDSRVRRNLQHAASSGDLDLSDQNIEKALKSVAVITDFSGHDQELIKNAYSESIKWCFISLLPWLAIGATLSLFLKNIDWKAKHAELGLQNIHNDNSNNNDDVGQQQPQMSSSSSPSRPNLTLRILKKSFLFRSSRKLFTDQQDKESSNVV